jgi:hypothetical protein
MLAGSGRVPRPSEQLRCALPVLRAESAQTQARSAASAVNNPPLLGRAEIGEIESGYGMDDRGVGVQVPAGSRIFSSPRRPDRFWGPPNLLSNGFEGLFPLG